MNRRLIAALLAITAVFALAGCEDETTAPESTPQLLLGTDFDGFYYLSEPETVRVFAADPDGIAAVTFLLDGHAVHRAEAEPYTWLLDPRYLWEPSSHTLVIRADDTVGSTAFAGPVSFRVSSNVDRPALAAPAHGAEFPAGDVPLHWHPFPDAADYEVQVALDPDFAEVFFTTTTADTTVSLPVDRDAVGHWRVRARNEAGQPSRWSGTRSFDMGTPDPLDITDPLALMDTFADAYTGRDYALYDDVLDPRFLFFFLDSESQDFWTKDEDLISADNLFSGEARTNSQGDLTRAITRIAVDQLTLLEPFGPTDNVYFQDIDGVQMGLYKVRLVLFHAEGTLTINSNQRFYAAPVDEGGWRLIGQEDMASKANENLTWSNLKALFR